MTYRARGTIFVFGHFVMRSIHDEKSHHWIAGQVEVLDQHNIITRPFSLSSLYMWNLQAYVTCLHIHVRLGRIPARDVVSQNHLLVAHQFCHDYYFSQASMILFFLSAAGYRRRSYL